MAPALLQAMRILTDHPELNRLRGRPESRYGVTLVELLVAMALIAALLATSIPPLTRQISHGRVNRAATLIASDLELALSLAGRQRKPVRVTVNSTTKELLVTDRATGQQILRRPYGSDSDFKLDTLTSSATVDLMPQGITTGAATFTAAIGTYSRTVSLARAGLVRLNP